MKLSRFSVYASVMVGTLGLSSVGCGTWTVDGEAEKKEADSRIASATVAQVSGGSVVRDEVSSKGFDVEVVSAGTTKIRIEKKGNGRLRLIGNGTIELMGDGDILVVIDGNVEIVHPAQGTITIESVSERKVKVMLQGTNQGTYRTSAKSSEVDLVQTIENRGGDPIPGGTAVPATARDLTIKISGVRKSQGQVCYSLFEEKNKEHFGKENPPADAVARAACVPVTSNAVSFVVPGVTFGVYGVALYHDEDGNGVMNKFGMIPTEPFGFSQNPPLQMGAPSFDKVQFSHGPEGSAQEITLLSLG